MEVLLKGSCDACTSSKVKCSGGNPCVRCKARDMVCSYRPKRKRGPQKGSKGSNKRSLDEHGFSFISTYERRVWSVFFTMFKNQNRSRSDAAWAWCWFVSQLEKLKNHLVATGNEEANKRLHAWLEALDVDIQAIIGGMKTRCRFPPNMCGTCSALAMCVPEGAQVSSPTVISSLHIGSDFGITQNDKPRLVMNCFDGGVLVQVNRVFEDEFGITGKRFEEILQWSAGGFLPWGGDILAKLLVKESDLHVFLQILAIKASSLGPPSEKSKALIEREVPSTHIFDLFCVEHPGGQERTMVRSYMLNCINIERIEDGNMTTQLKIVFESIGPKRAPQNGEEPVSCEETNKDKKPMSQEANPITSSKRVRTKPDLPIKPEESSREAQPRTSAPRATTAAAPSAASAPSPAFLEDFTAAPPPPQTQHSNGYTYHEDRPDARSTSNFSPGSVPVDEMNPEAAKFYNNWAFFDPLASDATSTTAPPPSGHDDHMSYPSSPLALSLPQLDSTSRSTSFSSTNISGRNAHHHPTARGHQMSSPPPQPQQQQQQQQPQQQQHASKGYDLVHSEQSANDPVHTAPLHQESTDQPQHDILHDLEDGVVDDGDWLNSILEWSSVNAGLQDL